jgi:hypothetical protein
MCTINTVSERWTRSVQDWPTSLNHVSIVLDGRMPVRVRRPFTQKI